MEITPADLEQRELYKLLIGSVVPRPIAWVSTQSAKGQRNLAPFSFFNVVGSNPPTLTVSINYASDREGGRKDTLQNIMETREFVVNIVTEDTAAAMNETATNFPHGIDEFAAAGLTPTPSKTIRPPRVAESPVSFECMLFSAIPIGDGPGSSTLLVGLITHIYIRDNVLGERNHVLIDQLKPIARLAGNEYCKVTDIFEMERKPYQG